MDSSTDTLIKLAQDTGSRVIYRFSPTLSMLSESSKASFKGSTSPLADYCAKCLTTLKKDTAAVMFDYSAFALYGIQGLLALSFSSKMAVDLGYYVIIDGCFGGEGVVNMCRSFFDADTDTSGLSIYADAVTISPYCAAEDIKALARFCREDDAAIFICAKDKKTNDPDSIEEVKLDSGMKLCEAAADDAGAFGELYVGEFGYSVLGFVTVPSESGPSMRSLDRWGLALVKATVADIEDDRTYAFFYPGEGEGEFIAVTDRDIAETLGQINGRFNVDDAAGLFREIVGKVEAKRGAAQGNR